MQSTDQEPSAPQLAGLDLTEDPGLEVDSEENDSAYAESTRSSFMTSIASSVTRGIFENGRRYHSYGESQYAFPNDERELERLDMQHTMQTMLLNGKLFWSPIGPSPQRILDLGTGTGIWALEMADLYPSAEVIGTDVSAIQPDWVGPNCSFEIDDAEQDWLYEPNSFDFIHNRNFVCAIRNWERLVGQTFRHVKPGGWVEWHEKYPLFLSDDGSLKDDCAIAKWGTTFFEAAENFGTSATSPKNLKRLTIDAGFVDVEEHILKIPVGPWPKDKRLKNIGLFEMVNMDEGLESLSLMLFTRALKWTREEVLMFLMEVRKATKDKSIHSYYHFYVVFGRKPETTRSV
ncbi:hypothetical protein VF21_08799 [Pseudogymnoascus sp. 05NY08]|nr:hypothetical protein VF21_08799 [Pseudogymnoascus sp. 05NY08]